MTDRLLAWLYLLGARRPAELRWRADGELPAHVVRWTNANADDAETDLMGRPVLPFTALTFAG